MARDTEADPLEYAMLIIESYQMDLRNSDQLLSPENIERLRAGETLAAIGFCQGSIYTGALSRIRALRDKQPDQGRERLLALARRVGRYVAPGICNECRDETCDAALLSTCLGWDARRLLRLFGEEATHADDDGPTPTR